MYMFDEREQQALATHHGAHGAGVHVLAEARVEGTVLQVDVVLLQQLLRGLQQQKAFHFSKYTSLA